MISVVVVTASAHAEKEREMTDQGGPYNIHGYLRSKRGRKKGDDRKKGGGWRSSRQLAPFARKPAAERGQNAKPEPRLILIVPSGGKIPRKKLPRIGGLRRGRRDAGTLFGGR